MMKLLAMLAISAVLSGQKTDPGEVQFRAAMHKQTAEGDLKGAIEQYKRIVARAGGNRDLAARALLQLGECYEKLGDAEARKQYERVVKEYSDRTNAAARAQARLTGMTAPKTVTFRRVWHGKGTGTSGTPSPDGRFLSYIDPATGNVGVRDLASGTNRLLTSEASWSGDYADDAVYSPDGGMIAYSWEFDKGTRAELRLISADGKSRRTLLAARAGEYHWAGAWTSNGAQIATVTWHKSTGSSHISLVNVRDGSIKELREALLRGRIVLSPDDRYIAYNFQPSRASQQTDIHVLDLQTGEDREVLATSESESVLGWHPDGKRLVLAAERLGSTSAYLLPMSGSVPTDVPQLIKRDLGDVRTGGFTAAGALYYRLSPPRDARFALNEIYVAPLNPASGKASGAPSLLAKQMNGQHSGAYWSPDGRRLAYRKGQGSTGVFVVRDVMSGEEQTHDPGLKLWAPRGWAPDGRTLVFQGRHADNLNRQGLFQLSLDGKVATLLMSNNGEMVNSPALLADGRLVYTTRGIEIHERHLSSGADRIVAKADERIDYLQASPDGKRAAFLTDAAIWVTSLVNGQTVKAVSFPRSEFHPGRFGLSWAGSEHLVYSRTSATDGKSSMWRVSATGGTPETLGIEAPEISYVSVSPDGKSVAYTSGRFSDNEIWVMENITAGGGLAGRE